jgi:hypothetical protein
VCYVNSQNNFTLNMNEPIVGLVDGISQTAFRETGLVYERINSFRAGQVLSILC